jgi:hypothetical protein
MGAVSIMSSKSAAQERCLAQLQPRAPGSVINLIGMLAGGTQTDPMRVLGSSAWSGGNGGLAGDV